MGADWGRYLYISYMSSLIVTLFLIKNNILIQKKENFFLDTYLRQPLFGLIIFIYCFGWTVPICCEKNFKSGFIGFVKKIILYF